MTSPKDKRKQDVALYEAALQRGGRTRQFIALDDWYPSYDDGTVKATVVNDGPTYGYRLTIWGLDDFGMEKFYFPSYEVACDYMDHMPCIISQDDLYDRGFVHA